MCRNNGPASLTKINKSTTKGAFLPILLLLRDLSALVGPVVGPLSLGANDQGAGRVLRC
ncbi:hypothetical protein ACP28F_06460 [Leclercia barmai]|uniref:hypothetical protein n=1 Tax=Leclercia barmai TaxID=2785629 RepID=UPI003CEB6491